jgi:glycosyltransferase involved in cell wall biosynthesis
MPRISVLLPVYNVNIKFLSAAINSILNQTFTDFEFIIINDNATQEDIDPYLKNLNDSRIQYFKNPINLGISATRNKLLSLANGEYIAIMDHDDISLPTRFEKQINFLDSNPDIGVVSTNYQIIPNNKIVTHPEHDKDIKISLMRNCVLLHPAAMIRTSVIKNNNITYNKDLSPAEDYNMWCALINYTKFHNLQEILFHYRTHTNNSTKIQKNIMNKARLCIHAQNKILFPILNKQYIATCTITRRFFIFGILPIFTLKSSGYWNKLYLFEKILLLSFKKQTKIR